MKTLIVSALLLVLPALSLAQTADKPAGKAAAAPKAKSAAPAKQTSSRQQLKTATNQVAAGIVAAEAALTPAELEIAERVHVGQLPCELGASVTVEGDAKSPGYFNLHGKGFRYRMHPVATSTGAIRLEDPKAGAVWLQLANKSMLMDQKQGRRLADECQSPAQVTVAEALKKNPAPSLIDTPAGARP
ncbi:hypothetical protein [Ramlibacter sp. 2FC]|uniref:hypothetical protein n=1 Tax=Ramlibacter sp. 2FC TaxID=2502188 RepID=UPI0010F897F3|nr:hypothetical protein [Ramlibacter sp. 2FC]